MFTLLSHLPASALDVLRNLWLLATATAAGRVFVASNALLLAGLGILVWRQAYRLEPFGDVPLREIEERHPHVPALRTILQILFVNLQLYAVCLIILWAAGLLTDARQWLLLGGVFLGIVTAGVLIEVTWRNAAHALYAFSTATVAFLLWPLLQRDYPMEIPLIVTALIALYLISLAFLLVIFLRRKSLFAPVTFCVGLAFWFCIAAFYFRLIA